METTTTKQRCLQFFVVLLLISLACMFFYNEALFSHISTFKDLVKMSNGSSSAMATQATRLPTNRQLDGPVSMVARYCPEHRQAVHDQLTNHTQRLTTEFKDVILVVFLNDLSKDTTKMEILIPYLESLHGHLFNTIRFCVPYSANLPSRYKKQMVFYEYLYFPENKKFCDVCLGHQCFGDVIRQADPNKHKGFMLIGDDTFVALNKHVLKGKLDMVWSRKQYDVFDVKTKCHSEWGRGEPSQCGRSWWMPWTINHQIKATLQLLDVMKNHSEPVISDCYATLTNQLGNNHTVYYQPRITDFLFYPTRTFSNLSILANLFANHSLNWEMSLPNIMTCLSGPQWVAPGINGMEGERANTLRRPDLVTKQVISEKQLTHSHPIKLLDVLTNPDVPAKQRKPNHRALCDVIIPHYFLNTTFPSKS